MYNLSNIYFYEKPFENSIDRSIELLIKSSNQDFLYSNQLLCIVLVQKFILNKKTIMNYINLSMVIDELNLHGNTSIKLPSTIYDMIKNQNLENECIYRKKYDECRNIIFIYNYKKIPKKLVKRLQKSKN